MFEANRTFGAREKLAGSGAVTPRTRPQGLSVCAYTASSDFGHVRLIRKRPIVGSLLQVVRGHTPKHQQHLESSTP